MLKFAKPVCFVATSKPAAAKRFYGKVLGLPLVEDNPFAIVFDAGGTMLRVQKVQAVSAAPYTALGWEVFDIQKAVEHLRKKGIRFEIYAGLGQDKTGVWRSPSGAHVAWFKDPDDNVLSLTQFQLAPKQSKGRSKKSRRTKTKR